VARAASLADTDDNAADLTAGTPSPVNSAGQGPGGTTPTPEPSTSTSPTAEPTPEPTEPGPVRIHDIQGTTRLSPLTGQTVTRVPGIVTGVRSDTSRGYWIQDPTPDADPRTSEGIFVFTSSVPTVKVGDSVLVSGKVTEYRTGTGTQTVTEIATPTTAVLSSGNTLPAPTVISEKSVPAQYTPTASGGSIESLPLEPATYALDYYESLEGMRVQVGSVRIVGRTTEYNELWVTTKPKENPTPRGGTLYSYTQANTGRLKVMSIDTTAAFPQANVGDQLTGTTTGPLDYGTYGGYTLQATQLGTYVDKKLKREVTKKQSTKELAIATYNVENLRVGDSQAKFDRLGEGVAVNLAGPDVVMLEEIQDDTGATNDGTVTSEATLKKFTDAVVAKGGPQYAWRYISPVNNADGGEPGGNIRQVFLFNPKRVSFVDRAGGTATDATSVVATKKGAQVTYSPGRINPTSAAWANSRKPLVGEFVFRGQTVFVIGNHFNSKGGDQPLHGANQPPARSSETQRHLQATEVNTFVKSLLAADKKAQVVVLGDLNDFEYSQTVNILSGGGKQLTAQVSKLPLAERYSYVYDGNSQVLDQVLTSPAIRRATLDVVHINAEFADQASDHDPQVLRFDVQDCG
jgi:predicted extracellular nuclease